MHIQKNPQRKIRIQSLFAWNDWKIRNKILVLVLTVALLSITATTVNNYIHLSNNTVEEIGIEMAAYSEEAIQRSADIIEGSIKSLETLALSPTIIQSVTTANETYVGRAQADIDQEIKNKDEGWVNEDASIDPLVNSIANNPVSDYLRGFMAAFPEEVEVFVTDIQGVNIAMTERTGDYLQADEGWWQGAFNNGDGATYVSEVDYDDTAEVWAIDIGVPIYDESKQVVGILRGTVDISVVFGALSHIQFGETGHAALLDRGGKILYARDSTLLMQSAPESIREMVIGKQGWTSSLPDLDGNRAVLGFQPMQGELGESLGWTILIDQDLQEVRAPVQQTLLNSLLIALGLMILLCGVGFIAANSIGKNMLLIANGAAQLAKGDTELTGIDKKELDRLSMRQDELGETGKAFNNLITYFKEMAEAAQSIADGNLTQEVQPRSDRDLLGNSFKQMTDNLSDIIQQLIDNTAILKAASRQFAGAADQAGSAVAQIMTTIQQVADGTNQQSVEIGTTVQSVEQMARAIDGVASGAQEQASAVARSSDITTRISEAIQQVVENARRSLEGSEEATITAREGTQTVEASVAGMGTIKQKVDLSTQKVKEMGDRSEEIGQIITTIEDIASQTNLLALNAAIESARAGEHGKGFAVVAEEVRKLAEKSASATKEIGDLIQQVRATVKDAITAMQESAFEVDTGVDRAQQAGQALREILNSVEGVNREVQSISNAANGMGQFAEDLVLAMDTVSAVVEENTASTEQMSASSSEVSDAIENIASISEENSAAVEQVSASTEQMNAQVEEVAASAQSLANMAETLEELVQHFIVAELQRGTSGQQTPKTNGKTHHDPQQMEPVNL